MLLTVGYFMFCGAVEVAQKSKNINVNENKLFFPSLLVVVLKADLISYLTSNILLTSRPQ